MDEGLLRREPTRKAAVDWCCLHLGGQVLGRHQFGPGAYSYLFGLRGESSNYLSVEREDAARVQGWDVDSVALYPYPDNPYQQRHDQAGA